MMGNISALKNGEGVEGAVWTSLYVRFTCSVVSIEGINALIGGIKVVNWDVIVANGKCFFKTFQASFQYKR